MKKWIFSAFLLSMVSVTLFADYHAVSVKTIVVHAKQVPQELTSIGTIASRRTTYIQTEVSGQVLKLTKQVGDMVQPGDVVANINSRITRDTLKEAQAQQAKASAIYQAQLTQLKRVKRLLNAHAITLSAYQAEKTKLHAIKSDLAVSNAQLAKAAFALKHTSVVSTVSGMIQEKKATVGSVLAAGDPIYLVADTKGLTAVLPFPQASRNKIQIGQKVALFSLLTSKPIMGAVSAIKPMINVETRSFDVIVNFENINRQWHPGASVVAHLTLSNQDMFLVPETSVINRHDDDYIYVVKHGKAYATPIVLGKYNRSGLVWVSGLKDGEKIVTIGGDFLKDGIKVQEEK